jgi:WG containing repeat
MMNIKSIIFLGTVLLVSLPVFSQDWVINPQFDFALPFSEGLAWVSKSKGENTYEHALIDETGSIVIPFGKFRLVPMAKFSEGLCLVQLDKVDPNPMSAESFFIDKTGNIIIDCSSYSSVAGIGTPVPMSFAFSEGLAPVAKLVGKDSYEVPIFKVGYIDKSGTMVIPFNFDNAGAFSEGLAPFTVRGTGPATQGLPVGIH